MEKLRRFVNTCIIFSLFHWIDVKVMTGHTLESGSPSPSTLSASYLSDTAASDSEYSPGIAFKAFFKTLQTCEFRFSHVEPFYLAQLLLIKMVF